MKRSRIAVIACLLTALLAARTFAQQAEQRFGGDALLVIVTIEPAEPKTIDDIRVTFISRVAQGLSLVEPEIETTSDEDDLLTEPSLGDFTVLSRRDSPPRIDTEGRLVTARTFTLEQMLPGEFALPDITFEARDAQGVPAASTEVSGLLIRVGSVTPQGANTPAESDAPSLDVGPLRGVFDPPEREGFDWQTPLLWLAGSLVSVVILTAAVLIWFSIRPESRRFERELAELRKVRGALEESTDPDRAALDAVWSDARRAINRCIADKLDPSAESRSDAELIAEAGDWFGLTDKDRARFADLLTALQLGRFAGGDPPDRILTIRLLDDTIHVLERLKAASEMVVAEETPRSEGAA